MKPIHYRVYSRLDWAELMIAGTRGWRRVYWRAVRRFWRIAL